MKQIKASSLQLAALTLAITLSASPVAEAAVTFDCTWSGAQYGNTARATASISFQDGLPQNPTPSDRSFVQYLPTDLVAITLTVSGASSGNGTFTLDDFQFLYWCTNGGELDFSKELVGQPIGTSTPWGIASDDGESGDFNLFAGRGAAPDGNMFFRMTTNYGAGDEMALTSMRMVPEVCSIAVVGLGAVGLTARRRRRA